MESYKNGIGSFTFFRNADVQGTAGQSEDEELTVGCYRVEDSFVSKYLAEPHFSDAQTEFFSCRCAMRLVLFEGRIGQ